MRALHGGKLRLEARPTAQALLAHVKARAQLHGPMLARQVTNRETATISRNTTISHRIYLSPNAREHAGHGAKPRAARSRSATAICATGDARSARAAYVPPP